jgi:hypothetical protein
MIDNNCVKGILDQEGATATKLLPDMPDLRRDDTSAASIPGF